MRKNKHITEILTNIALIILIVACSDLESEKFSFKKTKEGINLSENDKPVLFYQVEPKSFNGEFARNNYIHPLFGLNEEVLTEDFPKDHPHQRGVFWAWHQIYCDSTFLGDSWALEYFETIIKDVSTKVNNNSAIINVDAFWTSPKYENTKPFINEKSEIIVHTIKEEIRVIDFEIKLQALVDKIKIGGSNDAKGYGGFSLRIKMPDDLTFTSTKGTVIPQELQIDGSEWMDFSAKYDNENLSGLTLFCHPSTPGYVQNWILRQNRSMQNIVFPGTNLVIISKDEPTILRYRLVLHNGKANSTEIQKWEQEYNQIIFMDEK